MEPIVGINADKVGVEGGGHLFSGDLVALPFVERLMPELDGLILKIADLQHRLSPVGGSAVKCGNCGEEGHNARTCSRKSEQ